MLFLFAATMTKLSLLFLLLRFAHTRHFRYTIYALIGLTVLYLPIFMLVLLFECMYVTSNPFENPQLTSILKASSELLEYLQYDRSLH